MNLLVLRLSSQKESTLGILADVTDGWRPLCWTLEDERRETKVYGETRIPNGKYRVTLRKEGGFHQKYSARFPGIHKGMLWVRDVPGFTNILIHVGNTDRDTAGCLLLGDTATMNITHPGFIGSSSSAYCRVYPPIAEALERGEEVRIEYKDVDDGA